ncbi:MAG: metalloregulator ArsR/SmtB family transcription factor [Proteobacteria bacterium]|nr:metalloregulator ArsR/SmtB family transcription factor [Pseudomonadota bacterium]
MNALSQRLSLLAEPVRVRLLSLLDREELGVGEIVRVLQLPQSTVSRHLKALRVAGWIERRSEGTAGLFQMDAPPSGAGALWAVVRDDFRGSAQASEDEARLAAVLAAREEDPSTFFGRMHARWDALRTELFGEAFSTPALLALLARDWVVADLGCGTGSALVELAPVCDRVIGVDREQAMLDAAAVRLDGEDGVELLRGGLEDLPLPDATLDAALCMLVLHHVERLDSAFGEIQRVLKPRGRAVIVDMVSHDRSEYRRTMGHHHLGFSRSELEAQADAAGLRLTAHRPLTPTPDALGPPLFLAVLERDS